MKHLKLFALAVCLASPLHAQSTTFTSAEVRQRSIALLEDGQPAQAVTVIDLILAVRPNDTEALIIKSRALAALGDFPNAAVLSKRAFRSTSNGTVKFIAARLAAEAHAQQMQDTFAQLWLRRARQFAPDQANADQVAQDYRFLANRNPWSTTLRFGISPNSNVNNGSENETVRLFDLPFDFVLSGDARALSGLEISLGASTSYRLTAAKTYATSLDFDVNGRTYLLSKDAQEQAPDARGSDFSDVTLGFGITHRHILSDGAMPTTFNLRYGRAWYGGDLLNQTLDFSVAQSWAVGETGQVRIRLTAQEREGLEKEEEVTSDIADLDDTTRTYGVTTTWAQSLANGDSYSVSLGYQDANSERAENDSENVSLSANYNFAKPLAGTKIGFGFSVSERNFDATRFQSGSRTDTRTSLQLNAQFTQVEFYGFQPVANFEIAQNKSNVDLFDREFINFGLNLQSSF